METGVAGCKHGPNLGIMCDRSDAGIRQRNRPIIVIRDGYPSNQCWLLRSQNFTNEAMRPMMSSPVSNGACPSSGTSTTSRLVRRARIASTVAADRMSELPPRITMAGTRAKCVEFLPQRRQRLCEVGCLERGGQLHVVIGHDASAGLLERPARECGPVVVVQLGELAAERTAQDVGCVAGSSPAAASLPT